MKALLLILVLSSLLYCQQVELPKDRDEFASHFTEFRVQDGIHYYLNSYHTSWKGDRVAFYGFIYRNTDTQLLSHFQADCVTYNYVETRKTGVVKGHPVNVISNQEVASSRDSIIRAAIIEVCGVRL